MKTLPLATLVLALVACDGESVTGDVCTQSLDGFCAGSSCQTYDEHAATASGYAHYCGDGRVEIGICGEYRYVLAKSGFGGGIRYYDATGALVGGDTSADTNMFCSERAFKVKFGVQPACTPEPTMVFCGASQCGQQLTALCNETAPCATFAESEAGLRMRASSESGCGNALLEIGTCGELHYTSEQSRGGSIRYYDASGKVVGALVSADTNRYCNGTSLSQSYGTALACVGEWTVERLCP